MTPNFTNENKKNLIILTGPTAVGKTALSLRLANEVGGEIVSADSIQVYRHLDIGSAKIMPEEMCGIPHHLIDILEPDAQFNVMEFKKYAEAAMEGIYDRGHIPIITGGTGFYIQALLYDITFDDETEDGYRAELEALGNEKGNQYLHDRLREIDPKSAESIHANNRQRVIRALEYYHQTGKLFSLHNETEHQKVSPYNFAYFVLTRDRAALYQIIEQRIEEMLKNGLVDEVRSLIETYPLTEQNNSMQGIGYKQIYDYLKGRYDYEEAVRILKRDTRHFAKRQLTWFRREKEVIWLDKDIYRTEEALLAQIHLHLQEKQIAYNKQTGETLCI